jgi:hypothetical protein
MPLDMLDRLKRIERRFLKTQAMQSVSIRHSMLSDSFGWPKWCIIRKTEPKDRLFKLSDSGGLFLLFRPGGHRGWRFKYRVNGPRKTPRARALSDCFFGESSPEAEARSAEMRRLRAGSMSSKRFSDVQSAVGTRSRFTHSRPRWPIRLRTPARERGSEIR